MLPGMAPQHTRAGFGSASRLYVENFVEGPGDFIEDPETGMWLLPNSVAERDLNSGVRKLGILAAEQAAAGMERQAGTTKTAARLLGRTLLTDTGCMVDGLRYNQNPYHWVFQLAEAEQGTFLLDREEDVPHLQVCSTEGCYNTRHYDLDFGRMTLQERRMELNPYFYNIDQDGSISTIWGDTLPSLQDSMAYFIDFQRRNFPFIPYADAWLTASGVAHVRFQPQTGCWESWTYYCRPEDNLNWQFDGYGRLYQRYSASSVDPETGEITSIKRRGHWLAHRVTWKASGRELLEGQVLNHLCSYRRCCNPLHIEQVSKSENGLHGVRAQAAIRTLYDENPSAEGYTTPTAELVPFHKAATRLYYRLLGP